MATSQSDMDCTCPVCCDIFKDPVLLLCGHSFCKCCLQEWWRQSRSKRCPVCKETFSMAQPPRNLALRNLSDNLRREKSQKENSGSKEMCSVHDEKLKLFCEEDQQLICVICRDSQKHKKHNCVPINEAAESHRAEIKIKLTHLKSKLRSFKTEKLKCDKMAGHIQLQAQKTEKTITEEFEKLFQFLRAEKAARIDAVKKEAARKSEAMNIVIPNLTAEISSLAQKIETIEKDMKADISFMQNVKSTMERSQCNLPNPETPSGLLIDEDKHVGNLLFNVWSKMKNLIQYVPITLDPNTCGSDLVISEQLTCSTSRNNAPNHRILETVRNTSILSTKGISLGKCSWDVEVDYFGAVGVATKTKNQICEKIWSIYLCSCYTCLGERTPESFMDIEWTASYPTKLRVQLDYDKGMLSFFDLEEKKLVHTIKCAFTETVFPYFCDNTKLLPAELSVGIKPLR
ncbi:Tripartite motif-containing protein 35 Hemopoietic lineage switch protein 5 [Collichthys lucidus]|uniref:RING-type E3 ubiquitin transferase n=1 Tax=Collichthys lucidus TaxID=240159 RepID=A0A4U5UNA5_COLLU|nr:Tripartite motif-containing protein 35 Hemopoietic lineage switch protein 5 [Collichthys lucidus]